VLVPYELRPSVPPEGISAKEHGLEHSQRVAAHLQRIAAEEGIELREGDLVPNTHLALVLGEIGRDAGAETHRRVHLAIFAALYGRGLDIGAREVLLGVAEDTGLGGERVEAAWAGGLYERRLHEFRHLAMAMQVEAVPAALICNELLIGTRPLAVLEAAVQRCLASREDVEAGGLPREALQ
jgi:predicted DsbA family dithiol-disulfide isomerase